MKSILLGTAIAIVLAIGAAVALEQLGMSSQQVYSTGNVRL